MLIMNKNSVFKSNSIAEQMVWISVVFTFYLLESWSRGKSEWKNIFHCKMSSLAFVLKYCRDILLARDHVFFVDFLLRDTKHDAVFNCSKIASCWLVLVFNVVGKSFKKGYAKAGKLYLDLKRKKIIGKNI